MITDTIAAISTPLGEGGVSTVRISGDDAFMVAEKIFKSKTMLNGCILKFKFLSFILIT